MRDRSGWQSLAEWAVACGLMTLAVIGAMTIGIFVLPVAIAAVVLVARRNRAWPEAPMGALVGAGSIFLFVAYRNRSYSPCPPGPMRLAQGEHFSCGGFDPIPWLTIGLALTASGFAGYLVYRRTRLPAAAT
ncbi:MAG: hypothetical protein M3P26_03025 [Gemmatimonadota bacterium]|nr:hypothetical protein [Gemmatimonadota bacterium]